MKRIYTSRKCRPDKWKLQIHVIIAITGKICLTEQAQYPYVTLNILKNNVSKLASGNF